MLKLSRESYLNAESSPVQVEPMRQRQKNFEKGTFPKPLLQQVQVQAVTYPILSNLVQEETPRKVVPHIGKIRHLINARVKPRN